MSRVAIVGAGFSGAVVAHELAKAGIASCVFDTRPHVAGNCHTARDQESQVMLHVYGPHIFHTSNEEVWSYVQTFDEFVPFVNRVKTIYKGKVYSLPINLLTINSFFGKALSPSQAQQFIAGLGDSTIEHPQSFEEQALKFVGRELYEAFFKGYTEKQWGLPPSQLPASILKRLPVRFNYDDNYYASRYQGMPRHGYSYIVERMLDHQLIQVQLATPFQRKQARDFDHVFYSGPIDAWFGFEHGRLAYRTLDFEKETHLGDYQGNAVINYADVSIPFTRISEHKHFSPWEEHERTVIYKEFSRQCQPDDIPYYPIRLVNDKEQLRHYIALAQQEKAMTFMGRLGTYRYLDMHVTIAEALEVARTFLARQVDAQPMPAFVTDPLG